MGTRPSLRLPLEVGLTSVKDFAMAAVLLPFGLAIIVGDIAVMIWAKDANEGNGYVAIGGITLIGWGWRKLTLGWRARPTDIVLEPDGFRVDGGPRHNLAFQWGDIKDCKVVDVTVKDDMEKVYELRLDDDLTIAEADDLDEVASFHEVAAAIRARAHSDVREKHPKKKQNKKSTEGVLVCQQCGAPVAPTSNEVATCTHCNAATAMPPDVRQRVAASEKLPAAEQRVDRLVGRLLDQPGARSTTILLMLSLALIGGAWPVTVWAYVHAYRAHQLTVGFGFALATLPFLLVIDGFFLSRVRMVDRRALASLVTAFGAKPPANPGEPPRCRACSAPLRESNATVVRCVFCGVSNITGVDLRAVANRTEESEDSLEAAMQERNAQRWKWRLLALASTPVLVGTVFLVRAVYVQHGVRAPKGVVVEDLFIEGERPIPSFDGAQVLFLDKEKRGQLYDVHTHKTTPAGAGSEALFTKDRRLLVEGDMLALAHGVEGSDTSFSLSPNGAHIVFSSTRATGHNLFVMTTGGADMRAITLGCEDCVEPAWSADGFIYFVSNDSLHRIKP